jgi:hypothetical protein
MIYIQINFLTPDLGVTVQDTNTLQTRNLNSQVNNFLDAQRKKKTVFFANIAMKNIAM